MTPMVFRRSDRDVVSKESLNEIISVYKQKNESLAFSCRRTEAQMARYPQCPSPLPRSAAPQQVSAFRISL